MSAQPTRITVAVVEQAVSLHVAGRANCNTSCEFKSTIEGYHTRGFNRFVIDLTDCPLMDSTFLGVLAGFGLQHGNGNGIPGYHIELVRPQPRILELLESLGVKDLFQITDQAPVSPNGASEAVEVAFSKHEMCRTSLEAHETLMRIDPENVARFKDVTRFLAEDLKRLEEGGS